MILRFQTIHKERVYLIKEEIKLLADTPLVQENLKKFFFYLAYRLRHSDIKRLTWPIILKRMTLNTFHLLLLKPRHL